MALPNGIVPGSMNAINQALQARGLGMNSPALGQVSQGSPFNQQVTPPPDQTSSGSAMPQGMNQSTGQTGSQAAARQPKSESQIIVGALVDRLKSLSETGMQPTV